MPKRKKTQRSRLLTSDPASFPASKRKNDRRCIATGAELSPGAPAIRFVLSPDGTVTPDLAEKLPGRGVWVTASREDLSQAIKKSGFARGFKSAAKLPEGDFPTFVENLLVQDLTQRLGLARRRGSLITGFEKCREALKKGGVCAYIHGSDTAEDGIGKLSRLARAISPDIWRIGSLSRQELATATGLPDFAHGVLLSGPGSSAILKGAQRLDGFRGLAAPLSSFGDGKAQENGN